MTGIAPQDERPLIDPRVAAKGGTRKRHTDNYDYPGMMTRRHWLQTQAHKHTKAYGCAWCGQTFASPHAVYTHIDKVHPRKAGKR